MSAIGSLLVGLAVVVGGVTVGQKIGQKLGRLRTELDSQTLKQRNKDNENITVIEAEQDPRTGVYHTNK